MPAATAAAATTTTALAGRRVIAIGAGGGENGKFLGQPGRTAMRTNRTLPIAGANQDFAVALAFLAMKLYIGIREE